MSKTRMVCLTTVCVMVWGRWVYAEVRAGWVALETETVSKPREGVTNFPRSWDAECVVTTRGHCWVGTWGGLARLNETTLAVERVYTPADGLAGMPVGSLAVHENILWVGAHGGISRLDTVSESLRSAWAPGYDWRLEFEEQKGEVWALSGANVVRFEERTGRAWRLAMDKGVRSIVRAGTTLWGIRTEDFRNHTIFRLDTATGDKQTKHLNVSTYGARPGLIVGKEEAWALFRPGSDVRGHLLFRIDKNTLKTYPQGARTGLPHDHVHELLIVGPDAWVRTAGEYREHGAGQFGLGGRLCHYDRSLGRWKVVTGIGGIKHHEPTCFADLGGDLWVATRAYDETEKMVIGWGMLPLEADAPVVKALTLNRFLAREQRWMTFSLPAETNFDGVIDMALHGSRLWFLLEHREVPQSSTELGKATHRVVSGYVDIKSPGAKHILIESPSFSPSWPHEWGWQRRPADIWWEGDALWLKQRFLLWRNTADTGWRQVALPSPSCPSMETKFLLVDGLPTTSCILAFRRHIQEWDRLPNTHEVRWTVTDVRRDLQGVWWLSALAHSSMDLPKDSERNDEDRQPLHSGLFRSKDGEVWEVPSIAPWTWQQQDVDGEVQFLASTQVTRSPVDTHVSGAGVSGQRPAARQAVIVKAGEGVSCLESDGRRIWAGTIGEGVWCLESGRWRRLWPKSARSRNESGLRWEPPSPEDSVSSMALDGDLLWVATLAGLRWYDLSQGRTGKVDDAAIGFTPSPRPVPMTPVTNLARDGPLVARVANRTWFSSRSQPAGIYRLEKAPNAWRCVAPNTNARCFAEAGDIVWIGTPGGLLRYNVETGDSRLLTAREGLAVNFVEALALDDRFLWVGAQHGVSRLDR